MKNPNIIDETKPSKFEKWFETFLEEKNLPYKSWEIMGPTGVTHMIDSDVVIESIKNCHPNDQAKIKSTIIQIDFVNGDVNHFFKHLAKGLVANY